MKKYFAAAAALTASLLIPAANATPTATTIDACMQDGKTASMAVLTEGSLFDISIESIARDAFTATAKELTSDNLMKPESQEVFKVKLMEVHSAIRAAHPGEAPDLSQPRLLKVLGVGTDGRDCTP